MDSSAWFVAFRENRRDPVLLRRPCGAALDPELRRLLVRSLASFQVGEAGGGRIAQEIMVSPDRALDRDLREAVRLYVREEGRHAAELAALIRALGGEPLREHWTNRLFRGCRRALGLRTKLVTMAVAEVVGIVFYGMIAESVGCPEIRAAMSRIACDERRHLDFQAALFGRVLDTTPGALRLPYALWLGAELAAILSAAILTVWLEHAPLFRRFGRDLPGLVRDCASELAGPERLGGLRARALDGFATEPD